TDIEQLAKYSEGLICTSAFLGGVINQKFMSGRLEEAEDWAKKFKSIFGANYYLELIYTGMDKEQIPANNFLKELSVKLDIPLIITVDSHY
ncbi:PHP domain-containing protein, partial [Streptococcus pneumoniae]|uniref:PHP domain-containing protein n=1 Tax=Streptococcus pneumoniae TaxID=1313 RepID=UPI0012D7D8C9